MEPETKVTLISFMIALLITGFIFSHTLIWKNHVKDSECDDSLGDSDNYWTQEIIGNEVFCCKDVMVDNRTVVNDILMGEKHWHKECFSIDEKVK